MGLPRPFAWGEFDACNMKTNQRYAPSEDKDDSPSRCCAVDLPSPPGPVLEEVSMYHKKTRFGKFYRKHYSGFIRDLTETLAAPRQPPQSEF
ncbi:hypothetical protein Pcar_3211 [Syntrophotalea carbinolica DSM 2380]|uniref:Uncharacterized protein n=1 Tax=Syntrophotalea carbinolica (strain DSM 2380 / NBRC 103641 / GraBd1) TaxID=338963 RepID=Q0C6V6_SYNC1|nr:hypothetical protein Pcar_3211 [Syntrophotalea carbinolica DSM 2380]